MSVIGTSGSSLRENVPAGIGPMVALSLLVVLLYVSLMPYIRIFDGIPDLVAAYVAVIGLMRGPTAGAVVGFSCGLLVELTAPVGTLGIYAVIYMVVGAFCGRYCESPEAHGLLSQIGLIVAAAGFAAIAYLGVHLALGAPVSLPTFVGRVLLPQMLLTALVAPAVLLVVRRILRGPRMLEPGVVG